MFSHKNKKYSLRKVKNGVASVVIALLFASVTAPVAQAQSDGVGFHPDRETATVVGTGYNGLRLDGRVDITSIGEGLGGRNHKQLPGAGGDTLPLPGLMGGSGGRTLPGDGGDTLPLPGLMGGSGGRTLPGDGGDTLPLPGLMGGSGGRTLPGDGGDTLPLPGLMGGSGGRTLPGDGGDTLPLPGLMSGSGGRHFQAMVEMSGSGGRGGHTSRRWWRYSSTSGPYGR
ncbi:YSIRK-type signal peptide-containing protein [Streptococcus ruminantium]|uniref:YSIRK-type signal peptide-containing protein n=2 Tax=Streptococcus ruminantium TaxID=1917441 RepID=UPI001F27A736|nr:YSIRK-type signal peptide-containing protein [Streptococcus ruminantium]BDD41050.1 hypothetical protein GUT184_13140 [Streptococcus ruminantium]